MDEAHHKHEVVVIGAGIQGCCTALELARRGHEVILLERDILAMNRASLRNEGKIHLGLVYAADLTLSTAKLQLDGAIRFWPMLRQWTGASIDQLGVSSPFEYLVARDSLLNKYQLEQHYRKVENYYLEQISQHNDLDYLGLRPNRLYRKMDPDELTDHYHSDSIIAGFATAELSISTDRLATLLRRVVGASERIDLRCAHPVKTIEKVGDGYQVAGRNDDGEFTLRAEQVVNAAWDGRMALDRQMGLQDSGWVHRLKYRAIVRLPESANPSATPMPSVTMVLGAYGDVVMYPDGSVYLSWYPSAMRGWSHDLSPPQEWQGPCTGDVSPEDFESIAAAMIEAIGAWYPAITDAKPVRVDAGIIVARGKTDVDDPASGLHERVRVGVTSMDGYHSLDAGKLTTAPMFAVQAADRVSARI